ncbi:MAG: hypothetical protein IPG50_35610 [Myxococcales bacterium]|nr:hypothetical protein [Myxococcales bacterium]
MDAPPVVVDRVEVCRDAAQAASVFEAGASLALARGVHVRVTVSPSRAGLDAAAALRLPNGATEKRTFATAGKDCAPLARAMGAWISVRMDDWAEAEPAPSRAAPPLETPAPRSPEAPKGVPVAVEALPPSGGLDVPFDVDRDGRRIAEPSGPEFHVLSSVLSNLSRATLVGGVAGVTVGLGDTFVARGAAFAYSAAVNPTLAVGYRMDGCRRVPGRYARFRGMVLDLCAGGEVGLLAREVYGAFGPSVTIHGDLSRAFALDLGGGFSVPVGGPAAERPNVDGLLVAVRGDLGLTWRAP